jgi:hypothetical protein
MTYCDICNRPTRDENIRCYACRDDVQTNTEHVVKVQFRSSNADVEINSLLDLAKILEGRSDAYAYNGILRHTSTTTTIRRHSFRL